MFNEHVRSGFPEAISSALDQLGIPLTKTEQNWLYRMNEFYRRVEGSELPEKVREICSELVSECVRPFHLLGIGETFYAAQRIVEEQTSNRAIISVIYDRDQEGEMRGDVVHVKGIEEDLVIGNNGRHNLVSFNIQLREAHRFLGVNSWAIFRDPPFPGSASKNSNP